MAYKEFQDHYKETKIKHLLLAEYQGKLLSPPFATDLCKSYSDVWLDGKYMNLDLPPSTSKTNAVAVLGDSAWFIPYGIYDDLNIVTEMKPGAIIKHKLPFTGKGQFYSVAINYEWNSAFSFPLGYEGTNNAIYINNGKLSIHPLPHKGKKLHMGTVFCNGRYWSMPRGDQPGYTSLLSFDGKQFTSYELEVDPNITRKYSDIIVKGNTLYSLPFGETKGLNTIVEFDTDTNKATYHEIKGVDFAKKYNGGVLVGDNIVALPYGTEHGESNWGLVFNTVTKQSKQFDIGITHGGKYRYRCGIEYKGYAYFIPSGTPSCPIFKISKDGDELDSIYFGNTLFGRPIIFDDKLCVIGYDTISSEHHLYSIKEDLSYEVLCTLARS